MLEKDDPVNREAKDDISGDTMVDVEGDIDLINEPVTKDEVTRALISLRNGKAPGPDGIIGERERKKKKKKNASDVVLDFFGKLFNEKGVYPDNWTDSIIHPFTRKTETQMIQIITGVFLSQMLVGSSLVLLLTAGYKCGLT